MVSGFLTPGVNSQCAYPEEIKEKRIENFEETEKKLANKKNIQLPSFKNLEFWFKKPVIEKLDKIKLDNLILI